MRLRIRDITLLAALCLVLCAHALELDWFTIDGGGASQMIGGSFELSGTAGQPDAGTMTGGDFVVNGGFWVSPPPSLTPVPADPDGPLDPTGVGELPPP